MTFFPICITLFATCVSLVSAETVYGKEGSTAVLPCKLETDGTGTLFIRWKRESKTVFERKDTGVKEGKGYEGRVKVTEEELRKGNCFLVLSNLRLTDSGNYTNVQQVRRTKRDTTVKTELKDISSVYLSVRGAAGMTCPHPPILVLSILSCVIFQFYFKEP